MAYFERADERDRLILCNICNVKCAERGITTHRAKCSEKPQHKKKFLSGELERCYHDSSHIVEGGKMSLHLEFCNKYQNQILAEYQLMYQELEEANRAAQAAIASNNEASTEVGTDEDNCDKVANSDTFVGKMRSLQI